MEPMVVTSTLGIAGCGRVSDQSGQGRPESLRPVVTGWPAADPCSASRHSHYEASEPPPCHPVAVLDYLGGSPKRLHVGFVLSPSGGQMHSWQEEEVHSAAEWSKQEGK